MSSDVQVRICERLGVRLPRATRPVICFQNEDDAQKVLTVLDKRFSNYGLTLHPEKTRLVKFGRVALREAGGAIPPAYSTSYPWAKPTRVL